VKAAREGITFALPAELGRGRGRASGG
jgi:hypothetical protein